MPLVGDTLDALSGKQYFSSLDLKSGYWQIELHPSAQEKSAFVTHKGLYEFLVMPFGLTHYGASVQRLMGHILRGFPQISSTLVLSGYVRDKYLY